VTLIRRDRRLGALSHWKSPCNRTVTILKSKIGEILVGWGAQTRPLRNFKSGQMEVETGQYPFPHRSRLGNWIIFRSMTGQRQRSFRMSVAGPKADLSDRLSNVRLHPQQRTSKTAHPMLWNASSEATRRIRLLNVRFGPLMFDREQSDTLFKAL
jgi:hypothetical protein